MYPHPQFITRTQFVQALQSSPYVGFRLASGELYAINSKVALLHIRRTGIAHFCLRRITGYVFLDLNTYISIKFPFC